MLCTKASSKQILKFLLFKQTETLRKSLSYHSVVPHVAWLADRLVILHDIRLSSKDAITLKAAEVLQMPVLTLSLSVLITEDQL